VSREDFRPENEAVTETKAEQRKSNAGRKPYDTILKFKIVVLQSLHNLSDEQTEYLIRDRISFMRFLDLELEDPVPDATTIWLFREKLTRDSQAASLVIGLIQLSGQPWANQAGETNGSPRSVALLSDQLRRDLLQKALSDALAFKPR